MSIGRRPEPGIVCEPLQGRAASSSAAPIERGAWAYRSAPLGCSFRPNKSGKTPAEGRSIRQGNGFKYTERIRPKLERTTRSGQVQKNAIFAASESKRGSIV